MRVTLTTETACAVVVAEPNLDPEWLDYVGGYYELAVSYAVAGYWGQAHHCMVEAARLYRKAGYLRMPEPLEEFFSRARGGMAFNDPPLPLHEIPVIHKR